MEKAAIILAFATLVGFVLANIFTYTMSAQVYVARRGGLPVLIEKVTKTARLPP